MDKDIWAVIEVDRLLSMNQIKFMLNTIYTGDWVAFNLV
jgi:hypothetical protein